MEADVENIEVELTNLLREELNHLVTERKATINTELEKNGVSFSLTPSNNDQASVYAFYENGGGIVYLTVGDHTIFEVPIEGEGYTDFTGIEELLSIIRAVVNRGFEETIWESNGNIVKSSAKLFVEGKKDPIIIKSYKIHNPFSRKTETVKKYLPY